jgi:hypothetical protein
MTIGKVCALMTTIVGVGLAGCALEGAEDENAESTGTQQQPVTVSCDATQYDGCWQSTDITGALTIRVYRGKWSESSGFPSAAVRVESDYVVVGGGAEIEGEPNPGALLTTSLPRPDKVAWIAESKHHKYSQMHRLRAYSIGLKISGIDVATLKSKVTYTTVTSGISGFPTATASIPSPSLNLLLGGGAAAAPDAVNGAGLLLTGSFPTSGLNGWTATAKHHEISSPGTATATAISMPKFIGNFSLESAALSASSAGANVYATATVTNTSSLQVVTAVGGQGVGTTGQGRLLTDMYPQPITSGFGSMSATSKAHGVSDPGTTQGWLMTLRRL